MKKRTDRSTKPERPSRSQPPQSPRFGWHPNDLSADLSPGVTDAHTRASAAQPGFTPLRGPSYWTPPQPGELPPTIIQRPKPPTTGELLGRYSKPAMLALTVAAVGTSGIVTSQNASAEAIDDSNGSESPNVRSIVRGPSPADVALSTDDAQPSQYATNSRTEPIIYTVERGDWVRHIAADFGLQTMTVVWNNDLPDPDFILPGQELLILPVDGVLIEVQPGDTLNSLATRYGVSTTAVINYEPNGITDPDVIQPGQQLIIPDGTPPVTATQSVQHTESAAPVETEPVAQTQAFAGELEVEPGDTLRDVAQRFGVTVEELAQANNLADPDHLQSGMLLSVPETGDSATATPQTESPAPEPVQDSPPPPQPEVSTQPDPTPEPQPDPAPAPEPTPTAPPQPDPTPEPTAPPQPDPTPTPEPQPDPEPDPQPDPGSAPGDIPGLLEYYASQYGLDPNLVKALAWHESGWSQSARNPSGATGVMQIMPGTGTWINNNLISRNIDIYGSAADNIEAGVAYLNHMIEISGGVERGLASYYQGPVHVQRNGVDSVGRRYVDNILSLRDYIASNGQPPSWR